MPGQTHIIPIILGVQCCLGRASGQGSGASLFGGGIGRRLPTAWRRLAAMVLGRQHIHVICRRYSASSAGWLLGGVQHCLVTSGGGGASEKQLDNQLDCWWKAKGGVDERPVTVTNSDESQPPLAFGDDVWKAEENGRSIVCRHHDCHRRGGVKGGGRNIRRGPRKEREKMTRLSPTNDDGDARLQ